MPTYEMHLQYPSNGRVDVVHVVADDIDDAKIKAVGNTPLVVLECTLVPQPEVDSSTLEPRLASQYLGIMIISGCLFTLAFCVGCATFYFMHHKDTASMLNSIIGSVLFCGFGFGLLAIRDIAINTRRIN